MQLYRLVSVYLPSLVGGKFEINFRVRKLIRNVHMGAKDL